MWLSKLLSIFSRKKKSGKKGPLKSRRTAKFKVQHVDEQLKKQFWAIGGGKGGVGKSVTSVMLGATLTRWGKKVILVDADLGGSNLNLLTGIKYPKYTLADFMQRKVENIEDIALETPVENMRVICGGDGILGAANPKNSQKIRILNHLKKLEADIILLDLGAGTSYHTLDFFLFAPNRIVLMSPQSTAMQNAYAFIKTCVLRKLTREFRNDADCMELITRCVNSDDDGKIDSIVKLREGFNSLDGEKIDRLSAVIDELKMGLVVNMVKEQKDINIGRSLITVANEYLAVNPEYLGFIEHDKRLDRSVNRMGEFLVEGLDIITEMGFYDLANRVVKNIYKESKGLKPSVNQSSAQNRLGSKNSQAPNPTA